MARNYTAIATAVLLLACLVTASSARAADPGRWVETGRSQIPLEYYQGVTSDPVTNFYFSGHVGLFRTDAHLNETGRNGDAIPAGVHLSEGYNHIGDLSWDARESGRLLLPLECYYPGTPHGGNTCGFGAHGSPELGTGSIGVADPRTLAWRYYVKLDERDIRKAMWAETSPDGTLVWTSAGPDLIAYDASQITLANAAPTGPKLRPVRRLRGAVPPSGVTGATFVGERMFVAGQDDSGPFQVWSIDMATGARELEIERTIVGESEGLDTASALGGRLHWQIQPYNEEAIPTYGVANGTLLHFVPPGDAPPGTSRTPPPCCAPADGTQPGPSEGRPPQPAGAYGEPPARIKLRISPRRVVAGRRVRFRMLATVTRGGRRRSVPRAVVHFGGKLVRTNRRGRAVVTARLRERGLRPGRASAPGLRKGRTWVRVLR